MTKISPVKFIRSGVFGMSQKAFAELLGVSQAQVSRLEAGDNDLTADHQITIRTAAQRLDKDWNDSWFFEPPAKQPQDAA